MGLRGAPVRVALLGAGCQRASSAPVVPRAQSPVANLMLYLIEY